MTTQPQPGGWPSALQAEALAAGAVRRSEPRTAGGRIYWAEGRPAEGGRTAIVEFDPSSGTRRDLGPIDFNARTLAHEYGGGAWLPIDGGVTSARFDDQRLWRLDDDGGIPTTDEPDAARSIRYADPEPLDTAGDEIVWVVERHSDDSVTNELGVVDRSGSVITIAAGHDFYAAPTSNTNGDTVAFLAWDHPNMPWDHVQLLEVQRTPTGWTTPRLVLDGPALQQPRFSPDDQLFVVSDATGYWNLHRVDRTSAKSAPVVELPVEFGVPSWAFANRTYDWGPDGAIWCTWIDRGVGHLGRIVDGDFFVTIKSFAIIWVNYSCFKSLPPPRY